MTPRTDLSSRLAPSALGRRRDRRGRAAAPSGSGFALVITISLMVLLSMLAVGLLSLSSVALRTSRSSAAQAEARANARLAVELAIAELQKLAGDDRRITADGSMVSDDGRPHAVGVWESWSPRANDQPNLPAPAYDNEKKQRFLRWLVSGDAEQLTRLDWAKSVAAGELELFRKEADGFDLAASRISVRSGEREGGLAWAVTQENTKAKITVAGPEVDERVANDDLQVQPRPNLSLSGVLAQPEGDWNRRAARVVNLRQAFLDADLRGDGKPTTSGADFTTSATGLLTNAVDGGLKTDLSLGFEMSESDFGASSWSRDGETYRNPFHGGNGTGFDVPAAYSGQRPLYRPLAATGNHDVTQPYWPANVYFQFPVAAAPTFHSLRSFARIPHHLYKTDGVLTAFEREGDHVAAAPGSVTRGYFPPPARTVDGKRTQLAIRPVLDRAMFLVSGGLSPADELRIVITPIITLWNPHNVALEIEGSVAYIWIDLPYDFTWRTYRSNGRVASTDYMYMSGLMGKQFTAQQHARSVDPYFYAAITANGQPLTSRSEPIRFKPGEVRVFAPAEPELVDFNVLGSIRERTLFLRPVESVDQFSTKGGFSVPTRNAARNIGFVRKLENDQSAQLTFAPNTYGNEDYPFYISLEDATRAKGSDPGREDRGQAIADVLANNFSVSGEVVTFESPRVRYAQLKREPVPIGVLESYHRVAKGGSEAQVADLVYTGNPRQPWMNPYISETDFRTGPQYQSRMRPVASFNGVLQTAEGGRAAYYGASQGPVGGRSELSFFGVPGAPLLSLAEFQHADLSATPFAAANQFANSWASAYVPRDRASAGSLRVDHSYLLNEALWDGWFFSGAAPTLTHPNRSGSPQIWNAPIAQVSKPLRSVVADFLGNPSASPLRNPRMRLAEAPTDPAGLTDELLAPEGCLKIGGKLMVDGAFNVNSTRVEAWKAVLAGLRGASFEVDGRETASGDATPFPRFRDPVGNANDPWHGFRTLSDAQIDSLATALVAEVRARGPFLSLGEFVNRRLSRDELGLKGALQAAIDRAGINDDFLIDSFSIDNYESSSSGNIVPNDTGVGTPGYLTQADVLKPLAPVITVRSDTFVVRGYGEARDATGKVSARAWAEATVQRYPEFLDEGDEAHTPIDEISPINQSFGRRFRMVSFRYLSESELRG